jgi:predicted enzyme related to lactoylglutathione lyase
MDHKIIHFEIPADDVEALIKFYTELLAWKIVTVPEFPNYWGIRTSEKEGALMGGMMKRMHPQQMPTNYVQVESLSDYLAKAAKLGAMVVVDKTEIPTVGWFGVLLDPQHNPLGLLEMSKPTEKKESEAACTQGDPAMMGSADHSIVHFEIPADDVEALAKFYTELLGWKIEEAKEFPDYWSVYPVPSKGMGEGVLMGGMMKRMMPGQRPTNYVWVESVADYLAQAIKLGATMIVDKTEIPNMGWFGVLLDPQGNPLGLFEMMQK